MKLKPIALVIFPALVLLVIINGCKKETPAPHNPYDDIVRDSTVDGIPVDSLTITYVHKKVLAGRCALPACHDGAFEPDYRTPQSAFSTLVYAPVLKNNAQNQFKFRVVPYDTAGSVLYERITNCCFVNTNDRMPQDNIGVPLPDSSINLIRAWIMHGARDMFGNVPRLPNSEPVIAGYAAVSTDLQTNFSNTRLDSVYYNPFVVPVGVSQFYMAVFASDDSTPVNQLLVNQLKISTDADNFTGAATFTGTYLANPGAWLIAVNTASLPQNDTLYMRYYVNDGDHAQNTFFPRNELIYPYKTYWSFIRR